MLLIEMLFELIFELMFELMLNKRGFEREYYRRTYSCPACGRIIRSRPIEPQQWAITARWLHWWIHDGMRPPCGVELLN